MVEIENPIRKLADHLLETGMAMSDSHALEIATNISATQTKVEEHFNSVKDKV